MTANDSNVLILSQVCEYNLANYLESKNRISLVEDRNENVSLGKGICKSKVLAYFHKSTTILPCFLNESIICRHRSFVPKYFLFSALVIIC